MMPKVGPWLGCRTHVTTFLPRWAPSAWQRPTVVVLQAGERQSVHAGLGKGDGGRSSKAGRRRAPAPAALRTAARPEHGSCRAPLALAQRGGRDACHDNVFAVLHMRQLVTHRQAHLHGTAARWAGERQQRQQQRRRQRRQQQRVQRAGGVIMLDCTVAVCLHGIRGLAGAGEGLPSEPPTTRPAPGPLRTFAFRWPIGSYCASSKPSSAAISLMGSSSA